MNASNNTYFHLEIKKFLESKISKRTKNKRSIPRIHGKTSVNLKRHVQKLSNRRIKSGIYPQRTCI